MFMLFIFQDHKKNPLAKAFIRENQPDEPLDLLSSSISQHVTGVYIATIIVVVVILSFHMNRRLKLLINNAIHYLAATAPVQKHARDSGFEVADDGRLIIPEEEGNSKKSEKASGM